MKRIIVLLSFGILGLVSCKESNKNHAHSDQDKTTSIHHNEGQEERLRLDNGKKWIANDATHIGMTNINNLLAEYLKNKNTDRVTLAKAMSKETSTLISKCNMTGEAHDQLHLVLVPILESIDEIKKSNSDEALMKLENHLKEYFRHFTTK